MTSRTEGLLKRVTFFASTVVVCVVALVLGTLVSSVPANAQQTDDAAGTSQLEQKLSEPFNFFAESIHLSEALDRISGQFGINMIIDNRVVQPLNAPMAIPAPNYVTDGQLPYVNLKNVSLRQLLTAILRPLKLDFSVQKNFIWISTPKNIRHGSFEDLETRFYELEHVDGKVSSVNAELDKRGEAPIDVVNLLNHVVPRIVQPNSTESISFMRLNKETGQLIVHNTPSNHRIVVQALALVDGDV